MPTATFELKADDEILPAFLLGKGSPHTIRLTESDGTKRVHVLATDGRRITTSNARAIRHLKADPRFTLISETP